MNEDVQLIPVQAVRVINPRVRDRKRFEQIIRNIELVGLKRPISVTLRADTPEPAYDLVCGQGRLEAFVALGQTHIPAFVKGFDRQSSLVASLVENIARRRVKAIEQIKAIRWMEEQGQTAEEIARKTGLGTEYVRQILLLMQRGEERLLDAVINERIPVTIATKIAETPDADVQGILMEAYERGEFNQKTLAAFRSVVMQRQSLGRHASERRSPAGRRGSVDRFVASYRAQADRQKLLVRKARACEARLLSLTAAFRVLMADEDFVTLLRAEKHATLPKFLADRLTER
jgi:ParB family chromosome partitioning protein